jgi:hypothetical protein
MDVVGEKVGSGVGGWEEYSRGFIDFPSEVFQKSKI